MAAGLIQASRALGARRRERGVVLFIALIVMVAMALAGLGLIRAVDTGVIVAGNLAFKQGATTAGDQGLEAARTWLNANAAVLNSDNVSPGAAAYFANWQTNVDLTATDPLKPDFDWNANGLQVTADDGAGNRLRYVIHRLCAQSNIAPASTTCVKVSSASGGGGASGGEYGGRRGYEAGGSAGGFNLSTTQVFYRVTVRIDAPRNTVSYIQALMY